MLFSWCCMLFGCCLCSLAVVFGRILHDFAISSTCLLAASSRRSLFLCLRPIGGRRHYVVGLSVRPSVRACVRPSVRPSTFLLPRYLKNPWWEFLQILWKHPLWHDQELINFWDLWVKGQIHNMTKYGQKSLVSLISLLFIDICH